jgi:hypothetical protein
LVVAEASVETPALKDELLVGTDCMTLDKVIDELDTVLDIGPLMLLIEGVSMPAEDVLGRLGVEIDIETLLVVNVELSAGGEVNGWLVADIVFE